jgi:transcriptional regulator with XRE-family HTH domain
MRKKIKEDMSIFFEVLDQTPAKSKNYVSKSLEIVHQIELILREKNLNQKNLAQKLEKSEAEVSKWLSGTHNFTMRTLTAIETVLDAEIIVAPWKIRDNHFKYLSGTYRASQNKKGSATSNDEASKFYLKNDLKESELAA